MTKQSDLIQAIVRLDLPAAFHYKIQRTHKEVEGWHDWTLDGAPVTFAFELRAVAKLLALRDTETDTQWRIVYVCTIELPIE